MRYCFLSKLAPWYKQSKDAKCNLFLNEDVISRRKYRSSLWGPRILVGPVRKTSRHCCNVSATDEFCVPASALVSYIVETTTPSTSIVDHFFSGLSVQVAEYYFRIKYWLKATMGFLFYWVVLTFLTSYKTHVLMVNKLSNQQLAREKLSR